VLTLLDRYVSAGELDNLRRILPKQLQSLWPTESAAGAI